MQHVLESELKARLEGKQYDPVKSSQISKMLADELREKVCILAPTLHAHRLQQVRRVQHDCAAHVGCSVAQAAVLHMNYLRKDEGRSVRATVHTRPRCGCSLCASCLHSERS